MVDRKKGMTPTGVAARKARKGLRRSKTLVARRLTTHELEEAEDILGAVEHLRPSTRSECVDGPRPCPWVSCKFHLYLDVNPESGSIKLNFPDREVWEMSETCALDIADRGGITLEEVGEILNLTRERIRQVEALGLDKLQSEYDELLGNEDGS
ncbi:MAG: DNA-binding protein [Deltaproteobacteria bacterium]|nr:MAG: DNA-binding protein [Deltaproteobacteria bacterium]